MKISKYLSINSQVLVLITLTVILLVSFIVFFGLHKSILTESTYVLIILAVSLFIFLFIGLYSGFRIIKNHPVSQTTDKSVSNFPIPDVTGMGEFGIIILLWVAVIAAVGFFIMFLPDIIFAVVATIYWLFYRAYRLVFRHSCKTKGDISKSLLYSAGYTIIYTGWFFILIQAIKYFSH